MVTKEIAINTAKSFVQDCKLNGLNFYKVFLFKIVFKNQHQISNH